MASKPSAGLECSGAVKVSFHEQHTIGIQMAPTTKSLAGSQSVNSAHRPGHAA